MTTEPDNAPASLAQLAAAVEGGWAKAKVVSNELEGWVFTPFEILEAETAWNAYRARVADRERRLLAFVRWLAEIGDSAEFGSYEISQQATSLLAELSKSEVK